jgi:AGCS family alanine or glycine:cation symporter
MFIGIAITLIVSVVVLGGIKRISKVSAKLVPAMVAMYFLLVGYIVLTNLSVVPDVFASIFNEAFQFKAGLGGLAGSAIVIGARRAAFVNEAGVGTASMMHGASKNTEPIREGLVAMIGPSIDSGLVCTLTALAIMINGQYEVSQLQGIQMAMNSFEMSIPGLGHYLLLIMATIFAFSTMFSYSYYGVKCTNFLFGARYANYYNYFFLIMLVVGAVISLDVVVGVIDSAYALMAIPTMITLLILSPRVKREMKIYFNKNK